MPFFACLLACASAAAAQQPASTVTVSAPPAARSAGAANINITPRRVIFEGNKRTEAVYVFNQGTAPVVVDVSLVDNVMLPSGEILPVETAPERGASAVATVGRLSSARQMILATPSRLALPPGKGKTIRLRAEARSGQASEFRTHLKVATLPSADIGLTPEQAAAADRGEMVMRVQALFGVTIPLIVRAGGPTATAAIGPITLTREPAPAGEGAAGSQVPVLVLSLQRSGAASVYGNIEVRSGTARGGELIGLVRGVAVYPELDAREVRIRLQREPRGGEALSVTFAADDGKASELARGSFTAR